MPVHTVTKIDVVALDDQPTNDAPPLTLRTASRQDVDKCTWLDLEPDCGPAYGIKLADLKQAIADLEAAGNV